MKDLKWKTFHEEFFNKLRTEKYRIKYPNTWFTDNIIINKRAENWGISDEKALRAFLTDAFKLNNFAWTMFSEKGTPSPPPQKS